VIAHVVLFRPKPTLAQDERLALSDAFARAVRLIPSVRRARFGSRITLGRPYERLARTDYDHAAVLEFDDVAGLRAYLDHPAHEHLAARFFAAADEVLICDFELDEAGA
jgi:hypothetical protein